MVLKRFLVFSFRFQHSVFWFQRFQEFQGFEEFQGSRILYSVFCIPDSGFSVSCFVVVIARRQSLSRFIGNEATPRSDGGSSRFLVNKLRCYSVAVSLSRGTSKQQCFNVSPQQITLLAPSPISPRPIAHLPSPHRPLAPPLFTATLSPSC